MNHFITQLQFILSAIKSNVPMALGIILVLWIIHFLNMFLGYRLNFFGIYPRHWRGLIGIFLAPFLHNNFNHLFFNSIPLFVLLCFMLMGGIPQFIYITLIIILLSGAALWVFGRKAIHIGASSLIMGYWGYLLVLAYKQPSILTIFLAIICLYYFGGLAINLFNTDKKVSWEGHVFGFLVGVAAVYIT